MCFVEHRNVAVGAVINTVASTERADLVAEVSQTQAVWAGVCPHNSSSMSQITDCPQHLTPASWY